MESDFSYLVERYTEQIGVVETVSIANGMLNIGFGLNEGLDGDLDNILLSIEAAEIFGIVDQIRKGTRLLIKRDNYQQGKITKVDVLS